MSGYDARYTHYQLDRSPLRKLVRGFYLRAAAKQLSGPTVDFGCGIGELLGRLPDGSIGLEINPASVEHCRNQGLHARFYDAQADDWSLSVLEDRRDFQSLVISHVLEHLEDPASKLRQLLKAGQRLGMSRVVVIVPGRRGYSLDDTHRTFVDLDLLASPAVVDGTDFSLVRSRYFPGNLRVLGDCFAHHELQVTFHREPARQPHAG